MSITASPSAPKTSDTRKWISRTARMLGCSLIVVPILYLLQQHLAEMDKAQIAEALRAISLQSIAVAGLFTAFSLMAVARYDVLAIRQLGLDVPQKVAVRGGFVAVSIGQTLGFGIIVGAIARWRFYRGYGLGPTEAGMISAIVTIGFLNGFAIILSICAIIAPEGLVTLSGLSPAFIRAIAASVLVLAAGIMIASVIKPHVTVAGRVLSMPKLRVVRSQVVLAALDTIPAAIALWVLIPSDIAPALVVVVPVYLAALGMGLVSNTPGGLGVLELACLMALPVLPPEQLLAALIAYRGIYFGVPAVIAVAMLVAREIQGRDAKTQLSAQSAAPLATIGGILGDSGRADAQLALLGDKSFIISDDCDAFLMYAASGNSLIALSDPVGAEGRWAELLVKFEAEAKARMLAPAFYKTGPEFTDFLQMQGHFCTQIASEGVVGLAEYSTSGSSKRELRRKLKLAGSVELIRHAAGDAPLGRFGQVSDSWAASKGGERGFSMGYFKPDYLARFASIEARLDGQTVGFLSLWTSGDGREHGLDVMRLTENAPDGTMHALVHHGIAWAKEQGATRFALCAVPFMIANPPQNMVERALSWFYDNKPKIHGSAGLYRFKNAFRPDWEPRFGAAPGMISAAIAARDVAALINGPTPKDLPVPAEADEFEFKLAAA